MRSVGTLYEQLHIVRELVPGWSHRLVERKLTPPVPPSPPFRHPTTLLGWSPFSPEFRTPVGKTDVQAGLVSVNCSEWPFEFPLLHGTNPWGSAIPSPGSEVRQYNFRGLETLKALHAVN